MSENSTLGSMIDEIKQFCAERDWDQFHTPKEMAIGMITESSELLEIFRFKTETQCQEILKDAVGREKVADELADVFYFLLRFAERAHIDLPRAFAAKMEKNRSKYPIEKSRGSNQKYDEFK